MAEQVEAATEFRQIRTANLPLLTEQPTRRCTPRPKRAIEPALSPTITRKLSRVVPANLQIDARWDAIRKARDAAKKSDGKNAASPSVMIAWAVVRAMEKHAPFAASFWMTISIIENDPFDLGIAVALEGDRLATAVITHANTRDWPDFVKRYNETVEETRSGRVDAMNAPVVISSLGAFGVRAGAPIVVPPSVGTLFVGSAHHEMLAQRQENETAEVITLSLTFDHRVVNGAGRGQFRSRDQGTNREVQIPAEERNCLVDSPTIGPRQPDLSGSVYHPVSAGVFR